jgi:hypothetical protein
MENIGHSNGQFACFLFFVFLFGLFLTCWTIRTPASIKKIIAESESKAKTKTKPEPDPLSLTFTVTAESSS